MDSLFLIVLGLIAGYHYCKLSIIMAMTRSDDNKKIDQETKPASPRFRLIQGGKK